MKIRIKMDMSNMSGIGPKAWDRDESPVTMHTVHPHHDEHHHHETAGNPHRESQAGTNTEPSKKD